MKRIFLIFLIVSFVLIACDPSTYYFDAEELIEKVTKIELVECYNENPIVVAVEDDTILNFDSKSAKLVKKLEEEKILDFVTDLSTITFHLEDESVNSPLGYAVLIYTENNEIIVLSCTVLDRAYGMVAIFTVDGKFVSHIAQFADEPKFKKIIKNYFNL